VVAIIVAVLSGLVVLSLAADRFVTASAQVAVRYRLSPVVVGAVIIGFGTSLPELLTSTLAAINGDLDIGAGNIVGSNGANLSLVLGVAALMSPLAVPERVIRRDRYLALAAAAAFTLVVVDGSLTRVEAVALLAATAVALFFLMRSSGDVPSLTPEVSVLVETESASSSFKVIATLVAGLVGTVLGAQLFVWGAGSLTDELGLSGGFVGVSLVAVGTSMPEVVTAIHAARRNEGELIIGNVLGSNIFNSLPVAGLMALAGPGVIDGGLRGASAVMLTATAVVVVAMGVKRRIGRPLGVALLASYVALVASTL
jgi:cation:H+ antiporter